MTVEKFIEKYQSENNKDKFIRNRITTKYIPYLTKLTDCKQILESTSYVNIDGTPVFKQNSPACHLMFVLTLLIRYTDIEIHIEPGYSIQYYDMLDEYDLVNKIIKEIPVHEYNSYVSILEMMTRDIHENERNVVSILSSIFESFKVVYNNLPDEIKGELNG